VDPHTSFEATAFAVASFFSSILATVSASGSPWPNARLATPSPARPASPKIR
jgi:hypothetical protein